LNKDKTPSNFKNSVSYQPKKDRSYNFIVFMVVMFFLGFGWCVNYYPKTLISFSTMSKFLFFFAVIGLLIPLRYYAKWIFFTKYEVILINILGLAPFLTGFLLLLNYNFTSTKFKHYYSVHRTYVDNKEQLQVTGLKLEKNILSQNYKIIDIAYFSESDFEKYRFNEIMIYNGFLGLKVIKENIQELEN